MSEDVRIKLQASASGQSMRKRQSPKRKKSTRKEQVPEPAAKVEESEDEESEAPAGPTCDSCGSERLNLIEQIQYEHKLALDHVRLLSKIGSKEAQEIIDKVIDLEHVDEYYAVKIADVLPMHPDDVRSIFAKERFSLGRDEIDSIIDAVRETTGA